MSDIEIGTVMSFKGYEELEDGQEEILSAGALVEVTGWNAEAECYTVVDVNDDTLTDSAWPEELEDAPKAEEPAAKPKRTRAAAKAKPAAKEEKPAAKTKAKAPAKAKAPEKAKASAKTKTKAETKPAAKASAKSTAKEEPAGELTVLDTIKDYVESPEAAVQAAVDLATAIVDTTEQVEQSKFALGGVLSYMKENGVYRSEGYESIEAFCEDKLKLKDRSCQTYMQVYTSLTAAGIGEKEIDGIGISKLRTIAGIVTKSNKRSWLAKAKKSTRDDLVEHVKEAKASGKASPDSGAPVMTKFPGFKLHKDRGDALEGLIEQAKKTFETDNMAEAIFHAMTEWSQDRADDVEMDDALELFNAKYGTDIVIDDAGVASGGIVGAEEAEEAA